MAEKYIKENFENPDPDIKKFYQYLIEQLGSNTNELIRDKVENVQQKFES